MSVFFDRMTGFYDRIHRIFFINPFVSFVPLCEKQAEVFLHADDTDFFRFAQMMQKKTQSAKILNDLRHLRAGKNGGFFDRISGFMQDFPYGAHIHRIFYQTLCVLCAFV